GPELVPARDRTVRPLDHARGLARQGVPAAPCKNVPNDPEQHKAPLTDRGFKNASTDEAVIRGWWQCWPNALVGAVAERFCVIDIDLHHAEARAWLDRHRNKIPIGIPTVLDRFVQQAVMQVLQKRWNPTFSHHSYGFRPRRSAHQAVAQAQQYITQGYGWVIDLDLEKFFDRVNHDKLMGQIAKRVEDKRLLKLIRAFLNAGVMEN